MKLNVEDLALLKIWALTHDPPHKSHLIRPYGIHFGEMHKKDALIFREKILEGTGLEKVGLRSELESIIKQADAVASTFDRWVLRLRWSMRGYVNYNNLHNLFNPDLSTSIELNIDKEKTTLDSIVKDLNRVLVLANEIIMNEPDKKLLLYNALYALLEATWYSKDLPPALADTRTPTHTVFDHLYATASIVNMYLSGSKSPSGFYVLIDFPGIQKFINASRKTGDMWASSWLLSNVMWGVAEKFMNKYGFDVVLSPSPRLNPYALRTLLAALISLHTRDNNLKYYITLENVEKALKRVDDERITEAVKKILSIYATTYDIKEPEIPKLWLQPIIPASIAVVLPKNEHLENEDDVIEEITRTYSESWKDLVEFIRQTIGAESVKNAKDEEAPIKLLHNLIENLKDLIRLPPQGLNVAVVRIKDVYDALLECVRGAGKESWSACDDLKLNVDHEKLHALIREYNLELEEIAQSMIWHILQTKSLMLSRKKRYGTFYSHVPRPFWILEAGKLRPAKEEFEQENTGWVPCSLCGDEPAYVVLHKETTGPGKVDFSSKAKDMLKKMIGEVDSRKLFKVVKPGEALGPYCLVKRGTYFAFRPKLTFLSTDDVALSAISEFLAGLGTLREKIFDKTAKELSTLVSSAHGRFSENYIKENLEYVFKPYYEVNVAFKDIYALSQFVFETTYEKFTNELSEKLQEACTEVLERDLEARKTFLELLIRRNLVESAETQSALAKLVRKLEPNAVETSRLCGFLKLETTYAIIRGDADNIGRFLTGWKPISVDYYLSKLLESLKEHGEFITYDGKVLRINKDEEVLKVLRESYEVAKQLIRALGLENIPASPATHQALSLTLMLTSISDWMTVMKYGGMLVYSGGDDVLALAPPETVVLIVLDLRKDFYGNGFKKVRNTYITSAIPTGRSFSVRMVNILDNLAEEVFRSASLLEERAKRSRWFVSDGLQSSNEFEKDTLIVTSSRVGVEALLPLGLVVKDQELEELIRSTPLLLTLALSKNLPEDYSMLVADIEKYATSEALSKITTYVISRNISLRRRAPEESVRNFINELMKYFSEAVSKLSRMSLSIDNERRTAVSEFINFIALMRGFS